AGLDGVSVNFERLGPVLEIKGLGHRAEGELSELAQRHETRADVLRQRRAEDESARLHRGDLVDAHAAVTPAEPADHFRKELAIAQDGRDVLEENSLLGKVGDFADGVAHARKLGLLGGTHTGAPLLPPRRPESTRLSFCSARFSIWRTRSRDTPTMCPASP